MHSTSDSTFSSQPITLKLGNRFMVLLTSLLNHTLDLVDKYSLTSLGVFKLFKNSYNSKSTPSLRALKTNACTRANLLSPASLMRTCVHASVAHCSSRSSVQLELQTPSKTQPDLCSSAKTDAHRPHALED